MQEQTLGRRIQEARKAAGLSQESLGERLGVSRQAVSKWESDASVPDLENLIAMSRIFGVTIGALLGVEPDHKITPADVAAILSSPRGSREMKNTSHCSPSPASRLCGWMSSTPTNRETPERIARIPPRTKVVLCVAIPVPSSSIISHD